MNSADEIRRLRMGPAPGEKPQGLGLVNFTASCSGKAEAVLSRAKEVFEIVLRQDPDHWPPDSAWQDLLPHWFVAQCAPEQSREEAERLEKLWRQLPREAQVQTARTERCTLLNWVYWFQPEMREWYWWDASAPNPDTVTVTVEHAEFPFPSGALDWLLRAFGAVAVDNDLP